MGLIIGHLELQKSLNKIIFAKYSALNKTSMLALIIVIWKMYSTIIMNNSPSTQQVFSIWYQFLLNRDGSRNKKNLTICKNGINFFSSGS
jgi:hypothetical protein